MSASSENVVDLGFVEKSADWLLCSHFFPSKIGGKPAWLSLKNIPGLDRVKCTQCGKPCVFLLQVYANLDEKDECFHRTILLFICKDPKCIASSPDKSCLVFRSQLPRTNQFYNDSPLDDCAPPINFPAPDKFQRLCSVCGCGATKSCAKCHTTNYCSKNHQAIDWKECHKKMCGKSTDGDHAQTKSSFLFNEYQLVIETEDYKDEEKTEKSEEEKFQDYQKFLKSNAAKGLMKGVNETDLNDMAKHEGKEDKTFKKFIEQIQLDQQQVLRYDRGGEPLWVSNDNKPANIPDCDCGAPRQFEFQVMPQLLGHLSVDTLQDSIDWGILAVYTCRDSCTTGEEYKNEYVWKQDFSNISNAA